MDEASVERRMLLLLARLGIDLDEIPPLPRRDTEKDEVERRLEWLEQRVGRRDGRPG